MDKKATRIVKAHMDNNGVIIFSSLAKTEGRIAEPCTLSVMETCHKDLAAIHGARNRHA